MQLDKTERDEFLNQPNTAVLATVDAHGRPHAGARLVPVDWRCF